MNKIWKFFFEKLKNKYILTITLFVIWVSFFDQHNLIDRFEDIHKLNQLNKEKVYFQKKIEEDKKRLKELMSDNEDLEKFARETYFMKKDNEDVFVVIEE